MHIHITPRHLKLTAALHSYVADKISHLERATDQILAAHVVLWHDETRSPEKAFRVKVHLAVPGPDIYAEEAKHDLYAAIDLITDKLAQQLRKVKTKKVDRKKKIARREREKLKKKGV
jgi:putative sigma-54 modulation protein